MNPPENRSEKTVKAFKTLPVFLALISLLEVGFFPESSLAQQGFKWGRMEIHPGVAFEAKYNSNVFLSAFNVQEDFIFTTAPSLTLEQKRQQGDNFGFFFKYLGEQEIFNKLKNQDYYNQYAWANLEYGDVGGDINWNLGGHYANARNPISVEFASSTLNPRQIRTTYNLNSNLLWRLTHDIKADVEAQFSRNLFSDDDRQDNNKYKGGGTLNWQTTALTGMGVNYSFRHVDYLEANSIRPDNDLHSGSFIVKWKPLSVFSSEFRIGLNHLKVLDREGQDREDIIYKVQLNYQPKITSSWTLASFRETPVSYWRNNIIYQNTVAKLTWNQKLGVKWKGLSMISFGFRKYPIAEVVHMNNVKLCT